MAEDWERILQKVAPEHFGASPEERNFSVWSIVGQAAYNVSPGFPGGRPAPPDPALAPITSRTCGRESQNPGSGYQALSLRTGGYRYPSCEDDYTEMFQLMSQGVISGSRIPCAFAVPTPESGEEVALDTVEMTYSSNGVLQDKLARVASVSDCDDKGFLIQGDRIELCPATCQRIGQDADAELETLFGCTLEIR